MEFADGGDLMAKINEHKNKCTYIPEEELWRILIETTSGLKALHDRKILHRDIKVTHIRL
jgi:NIMA (never in mitosis gene a)-related kinase